MQIIWKVITGKYVKYLLVPVIFSVEHLYLKGNEKIFQEVRKYRYLKRIYFQILIVYAINIKLDLFIKFDLPEK